MLSDKEIGQYRRTASLPVPPIKLLQRYLMAATEALLLERKRAERINADLERVALERDAARVELDRVKGANHERQ